MWPASRLQIRVEEVEHGSRCQCTRRIDRNKAGGPSYHNNPVYAQEHDYFLATSICVIQYVQSQSCTQLFTNNLCNHKDWHIQLDQWSKDQQKITIPLTMFCNCRGKIVDSGNVPCWNLMRIKLIRFDERRTRQIQHLYPLAFIQARTLLMPTAPLGMQCCFNWLLTVRIMVMMIWDRIISIA